MSTPVVPAPALRGTPPPDPPHRSPVGHNLIGGLLVLIGLGWLLEFTGLLDVRWQTVLSLALMAVGGVLLVRARSRRLAGLVPLGIVLTVLLAVTTTVTSVSSGAGEREYRPTSVAQLADSYDLGAGTLLLDLRDLTLPRGTTTVTAHVGLGELAVRVPPDVFVRVEASAGAGDIEVLDSRRSGLAPSLRRDRGTGGAVQLVLDLSVGLGSIEVTS